MGKARKQTRRKPSGFVPDDIQAVETMMGPDESSYSLGIDDEIEEYPAQKRTRFSLNGDSFGIPKEVMSLSRMSRSEREKLVHRFKMELEQVREFRRRIASFTSETVLLSPYSDIHSCSDGPMRLQEKKPATVVGSHGKKRPPVRSNKQPTKKGHPGSARLNVPTSSTVASLMKECETLLSRLWSHKFGLAFRTPVDPVLLNIPDYFTVIKHPMDLGTIKSRLRRDEYSSPLDFAADVRLTFSNCMAYNPPGNAYHKMALSLSNYFESKWITTEKKIPVTEQPARPLTSSASLESEIPFKVTPPRKKAAAVNERKPRVEPAKLVMTDDEKKKLSLELGAFEEEFPQSIIDLLKEQSGNDGQTGDDEIEIDIDTLPGEVLFKIRKLLDDFLRGKKISQQKNEPCEMEIVHDSGFSNSHLQSSKGDLVIDEDVDIVGGNEPPVSSYPSIKIEKDAPCRNNEPSCSSNSSSESGSSSSDSDSDSCSSSGCETDSNKASNPSRAEDEKEPGVGINKKDDDNSGEKIVIKDSLNEMGQVEHDVGENSTPIDAVGVFPDEKRYRAALLKNRFADTIMKAREKTKGEKGDPEKLRIEREEFEKRLREEKVRLQAEAKAAEEARRKAEEQAAEKARRERAQEREAAREALQKMEKTVEINEGIQFMEDLEMLRATGAEGDQLPTFMEEMSPKCSQEVLGSFKMEGNSNPLEQLGLYMRMDEDEEEEDEPQFSQVEVEEDHALFRIQELCPRGVKGEDQLVSGDEEPVSQEAKDNENQDDEKLINQNERKEVAENVSEQETDVVDIGEEETEVVNIGEETEVVVDKTEQETEVAVAKTEQETEVVEKGKEEAEVFDKGDQVTEVFEKVGEETEVVEKGEEETEVVVAKTEQETEVVVAKTEQETEVVEKGKEEAEVFDKGDQVTEVFEKVEEETEVVEKGEEETEVVEKGEHKAEREIVEEEGEQETEIVEGEIVSFKKILVLLTRKK